MAGSPAPSIPRYGARSLGELVPSLLSSLGLAGFGDPLAVGPAARVCLLLVDGLGWELPRRAGWLYHGAALSAPCRVRRRMSGRGLRTGRGSGAARSLSCLSEVIRSG